MGSTASCLTSEIVHPAQHYTAVELDYDENSCTSLSRQRISAVRTLRQDSELGWSKYSTPMKSKTNGSTFSSSECVTPDPWADDEVLVESKCDSTYQDSWKTKRPSQLHFDSVKSIVDMYSTVPTPCVSSSPTSISSYSPHHPTFDGERTITDTSPPTTTNKAAPYIDTLVAADAEIISARCRLHKKWVSQPELSSSAPTSTVNRSGTETAIGDIVPTPGSPDLKFCLQHIAAHVCQCLAQQQKKSWAKSATPETDKIFDINNFTDEEPLLELERASMTHAMQWLFRVLQIEPQCTVIMAIYLQRIVIAGIAITSKNYEPLLIACLLVSTKVWDDLSTINEDFAAVLSQYSIDSLNRLERVLLSQLQWSCHVKAEEYTNAYFALAAGMARGGAPDVCHNPHCPLAHCCHDS